MARYWVGGTASWDNTAGTKWSTTSGGAGGASVPTSADDVFFDANSGTNTITITSAAVCKSINGTGSTATLAGSSTLAISGDLNIGGLTVTYTGTATLSVTCNLTSNGKTWTGALTFTGTSQTYTFIDNWTVNGTVTFNGGTAQTINGSTLICNGNLTSTTASVYVTGTTNISMQGTSTIVGSSGGYALNIDINTAGTVSFTGVLYFRSGTFSLTSGTINAGTSTINHLVAGTFVLSLGSANLYNVTLNATSTIGTALNVSNILSVSGTVLNTYAVNCSGSLTVIGTVSGSSLITLNGTGTWSGSGSLANNITINTSGTITFSGSVNYRTGTLTYTTGGIVVTGSTLLISGSCTLATNGINWNNFSLNTSSTVTLTNDLTVNGTLTTATGSASFTFNGSTLYLGGNISSLGAGAMAGTTNVIYNGTGTWDHTSTGVIRNNFTINTSGTLTLGASIKYDTGTLTYISGTVDTTTNNNTLTISTNSTTLNTNGINWNNVVCATTGSLVITLTSDWNISGTATLGSSSQNMTINGAEVRISGILTSIAGQVPFAAGTSTIRMVGTSCSIVDNSTLALPNNSLAWANPIVIDTAGTCTITGRFCLGNGGSITHVSGTVLFTSSAVNTSYFTQSNNITTTIDTGASVVWNEIRMLFVGVVNLNSTLNALTISVNATGTVTFQGTHGFVCNTFTSTTSGRIINLKAGNTYTVNNSLTITGGVASRITLQSTTTSHAYFNLNPVATQSVTNTNATWINSSGGKTIFSSAGTLSNTINWAIGSGNFFLMF